MTRKSISEKIQHQWFEDRAAYIKERFGGVPAWSFSCEHEIFVIDNSTCDPANIEKTSELIHTFGRQLGWTRKENYAGLLPKYSKEISAKRYSQIKFDTEPHLIEVAFTYFWKLDEFYEHLSEVLETLHEIAKNMNLSLQTDFHISDEKLSLIEPRTEYFKGLKFFRESINTHPGGLSVRDANYGAQIAATQVHIGGPFVGAACEERLITALYAEESNILAYSHQNKSSIERWKFYENVYGSFPLLGFPDIDMFTFKKWFQDIEKSPIYDEDIFPEFSNLSQINFEDYERLKISQRFKKIRDFQIIRPRIYGTLEFRADPAQNDAKAIFFMVLLRLGLAIYHYHNSADIDLTSSRAAWWKQIRSSEFKIDSSLQQRALIGLGLLESATPSCRTTIKEFFRDVA